MPIFPRYGIMHGPDDHVTDELRDKATAKTREVMAKLEAIRKGLELPPDALGLVVTVYGDVLAGLVNDDTRERGKARHKRQKEKLKAAMASGNLPGPGQFVRQIPPGFVPGYPDPEFDFDDED